MFSFAAERSSPLRDLCITVWFAENPTVLGSLRSATPTIGAPLRSWCTVVGLVQSFAGGRGNPPLRVACGHFLYLPIPQKNALHRGTVQCVFRMLMKCRVFISSRRSFWLPFSLRRAVLQMRILLFSPWGRRVLRFLQGMRISCAKYHAHSR